MTDLNVNALEQDVDDDADVVDSWMLYLRAPALTLDASQVLQSLVQITQPLDLLNYFLLIFYKGTYFSLDWIGLSYHK